MARNSRLSQAQLDEEEFWHADALRQQAYLALLERARKDSARALEVIRTAKHRMSRRSYSVSGFGIAVVLTTLITSVALRSPLDTAEYIATLTVGAILALTGPSVDYAENKKDPIAELERGVELVQERARREAAAAPAIRGRNDGNA